MATKADFTEEEWETMQKGVTGAGLLTSTYDRDFTDTFGEANALAKYLQAEHLSASSPLMRELAESHHTGFGVMTKVDKLEAETLAALRAATETLEEKAPEEVDAYRALAVGAADHVAQAKGEGISEKETEAIDKIKEALGAT